MSRIEFRIGKLQKKNQLNDEITQWHTAEWIKKEGERERAKTKRLQHHACYFLLDTHYCISPCYYRAAMPRPNSVSNKRERANVEPIRPQPILLWLCNDSNRWKSKSNVAVDEATNIGALHIKETYLCCCVYDVVFHFPSLLLHFALSLIYGFVVALALALSRCLSVKQTLYFAEDQIPFDFTFNSNPVCTLGHTEIISSFVELKAENILMYFTLDSLLLRSNDTHTHTTAECIKPWALIKLSHFHILFFVFFVAFNDFSYCIFINCFFFSLVLLLPLLQKQKPWRVCMKSKPQANPNQFMHCFTKTHDSFSRYENAIRVVGVVVVVVVGVVNIESYFTTRFVPTKNGKTESGNCHWT